jgi:DNA-binding beta-propeller fold protein YncE
MASAKIQACFKFPRYTKYQHLAHCEKSLHSVFMPGGNTMKKRLLVWPALIVSLLLPLMAACGSGLPQQSGSTNQVVRSAGNELYVLDSYTNAEQSSAARHIVALPMGTANPVPRFTLPAGLTDLKHQWVYLASPLSAGSARTDISVFDTRSGSIVRTFSIPGSYSTSDRGYADSMLSGDGHWLALREQHAPAGTTSLALVNTETGKLVKSIHLAGDFTLDAVSPKGTVLYLLEYYQFGTSHYNVRAYDVQANQLLPGDIVDKTDLGDKMQGESLARSMSDDGDMAYTLYINPVLNKAFIHILWLADTTANSPFPAIARCIDLPVGKSGMSLRYYTLALSQDGQTLYAANAALGTIATINLNPGLTTYQLWTIPNAKVAYFEPGQSTMSAADKVRELYKGSVLAPGRGQIYVTGLHGIWAINTTTLQVQAEYLKQQSFTGLAISSDGQTLYAVDPATGITLLDPSTGKVRAIIQGAIHAPWGIEWASN